MSAGLQCVCWKHKLIKHVNKIRLELCPDIICLQHTRCTAQGWSVVGLYSFMKEKKNEKTVVFMQRICFIKNKLFITEPFILFMYSERTEQGLKS